MVELEYERIIDRHKGQGCWVICHGPSLKEKINEIQNDTKSVKFCCNNWWDFTGWPPTYWVLASTVDRIDFLKERIAKLQGTEVYYASSVDNSKDYGLSNLFAYDQKHYKQKCCKDIMKEFKERITSGQKLSDIHDLGNPTLWECYLSTKSSGFGCQGKCNIGKTTIQEALQKEVGYNDGEIELYSTADSVAMHMIALAILMGCSPIRIAGMDLDYSLGYANGSQTPGEVAWNTNRKKIAKDIQILYDAAKSRGLEVEFCNHNAWYIKEIEE